MKQAQKNIANPKDFLFELLTIIGLKKQILDSWTHIEQLELKKAVSELHRRGLLQDGAAEPASNQQKLPQQPKNMSSSLPLYPAGMCPSHK